MQEELGFVRMSMSSIDTTAHLTVRVGCKLVYESVIPTAALLCLRVRPDEHQTLAGESITFAGEPLDTPRYNDPHGNSVHRVVLPAGSTEIVHDAIVTVRPEPDNFNRPGAGEISPHNLPDEVLRYTLPSRYCDFDRLLAFAWNHFAHIEPGLVRVHAISDWLHHNIEYRFGSGRPDLTAWDIIQRGHGVCRDFAHMIIALCRALNMPARYVVGHLPDIGYTDPGTPMDFHAYAEVYLEGGWFTIDPRYNVPRIGRVTVSRGLDAVNCAFTTSYGAVNLRYFEVWAYQVPSGAVKIGDPIDLSLRLDGTPEIRR